MRDRPDDPAALAEVVRRLMTIRNRLGVAAFRDVARLLQSKARGREADGIGLATSRQFVG